MSESKDRARPAGLVTIEAEVVEVGLLVSGEHGVTLDAGEANGGCFEVPLPSVAAVRAMAMHLYERVLVSFTPIEGSLRAELARGKASEQPAEPGEPPPDESPGDEGDLETKATDEGDRDFWWCESCRKFVSGGTLAAPPGANRTVHLVCGASVVLRPIAPPIANGPTLAAAIHALIEARRLGRCSGANVFPVMPIDWGGAPAAPADLPADAQVSSFATDDGVQHVVWFWQPEIARFELLAYVCMGINP